MALAVGNDLVELSRIERAYRRLGEKFLKRLLTEREMSLLPQKGKRRISFLAGRWAAKEAIAKALGKGISGGIGLSKNGIPLTDIEILREETGAPKPMLHRRARKRAEEMGISEVRIAITHSREIASAVALLF